MCWQQELYFTDLGPSQPWHLEACGIFTEFTLDSWESLSTLLLPVPVPSWRSHSGKTINFGLFQWVSPAWGYSLVRAPDSSASANTPSSESSSKTAAGSGCITMLLWLRCKTKLLSLVTIIPTLQIPGWCFFSSWEKMHHSWVVFDAAFN